ncbi:MAG TPA: hypothetical protein VG938_04425 [Verrucomicrobiae bacterium]|nr:hypothetical protein [Verrucomicrobiae bacterium]
MREPTRADADRALYLFRAAPVPRQARVLVAVKTQPLERFVAAAAWWPMGDALGFRLAVQPGSAVRLASCSRLIQQLAERGRAAGIRSLRYADLLLDQSEWAPLLKENGFVVLHSERFFEVPAREARARTMEIAERMRDKFPPAWRTDSIRHHRPETILDFIEPYHLMPAEEVCDRWRDDCPYGFELDLSAILFDGARPVGVFLMRRKLDMLFMDVRVVQTGNRLLNSLANVALLRYTCVTVGPVPNDLKRLQFRGGEMEHRETANLALRMGGSELPPRHTYARSL